MSERQSAAAQTRERILTATLHVIQEHGAHQLTLEEVARRAQVSKGGLLHHFPSKDTLLEEAIRYVYSLFNDCAEKHFANQAEGPGRWLRAYVRATFDDFELPLEMLINLFVYANSSEKLRRLVLDDLAQWNARFADDGIPPMRSTIVRMVCDSYWTERLVRVQQVVSPEALCEEMLRMIDA